MRINNLEDTLFNRNPTIKVNDLTKNSDEYKLAEAIESDDINKFTLKDWLQIVDVAYKNEKIRAMLYSSYRTPSNFIQNLLSREDNAELASLVFKRQNITQDEFNLAFKKSNNDIVGEKFYNMKSDIINKEEKPREYFSPRAIHYLLNYMFDTDNVLYDALPLRFAYSLSSSDKWLDKYSSDETIMTNIALNDKLSDNIRNQAYKNGIILDDTDSVLTADMCEDIYQSCVQTYTDSEYKTNKMNILSAGELLSELIAQPNFPASCQKDLFFRIKSMSDKEDIADVRSYLSLASTDESTIKEMQLYPHSFPSHLILSNPKTPDNIKLQIAKRLIKKDYSRLPLQEQYTDKIEIVDIMQSLSLNEFDYIKLIKMQDPILNMQILSSPHTSPKIACSDALSVSTTLSHPVEKLFVELAKIYFKHGLLSQELYVKFTDGLKQEIMHNEVFDIQDDISNKLDISGVIPFTDSYCCKNLSSNDYEVFMNVFKVLEKNKKLITTPLQGKQSNIQNLLQTYKETITRQYKFDKVFRNINELICTENDITDNLFYLTKIDTGHNLTYFPDLKVLASIKNFDNYKEKIINLLSENINPFALRSLENQIVMELLNDYNNENFIDFTYKYPNANKFYAILNEVLEIKREKEKTNVDETISK